MSPLRISRDGRTDHLILARPAAGTVKVDPDATMEQCPFSLPAELLTSSGLPVSRKNVAYADEQAGFSVGLWACTLTGDDGVTAS
ncbi:MAG: hypothetical protein ABI790_14085, partial [Betaproteobacteria bacterium]